MYIQKAYTYKHQKIKVIILAGANTSVNFGIISSVDGNYIFENIYFLHISHILLICSVFLLNFILIILIAIFLLDFMIDFMLEISHIQYFEPTA